MPRESSLPRARAAASGFGPVPSDLERGAGPAPRRSGGAVAPHDPTPAAPLPAASPAQTAGAPSARQAPGGRGEGGGPPPHRGEAVAWPGTPGLGTPERRPAADQSRDYQADEVRHAPGPDTAPTASAMALLCPPSPP